MIASSQTRSISSTCSCPNGTESRIVRRRSSRGRFVRPGSCRIPAARSAPPRHAPGAPSCVATATRWARRLSGNVLICIAQHAQAFPFGTRPQQRHRRPMSQRIRAHGAVCWRLASVDLGRVEVRREERPTGRRPRACANVRYSPVSRALAACGSSTSRLKNYPTWRGVLRCGRGGLVGAKEADGTGTRYRTSTCKETLRHINRLPTRRKAFTPR